jgi:hypothetical protein
LRVSFRDGRVQPPKAHLVDIGSNNFRRGISSEIDVCTCTWLENTKHLVDRFSRLGKILECGTANDEIKCLVIKCQGGSITVAKIDGNRFSRRIVLGDLDEGFTNVESSDFVSTSLCEFDREVARPRCTFENSAAWRNLLG